MDETVVARGHDEARIRGVDVGQDHDDLVAEVASFGGILDDQRAVEALGDLHGRVDVRVVPVEPRVGYVES